MRIAYVLGYSIAFIGTMFIPIAGWVGKIAKVDKLIPDELLTLLKTQGANLAKQLNTKTRNSKLKVLQQCAELLEIFAKGKDEIKRFFEKIGNDIGKWFLKRTQAASKEVGTFVRALPKNVSVFVLNLMAKVPGLEIIIVNKLLVAQFKGSTWFKMNPRGILVELNFTKKLPTGRQTITELRKVKIELETINIYGKVVKNKYVDDVEVFVKKLDDGTELFGFKPIFNEGKVHEAHFINQTFKRTESGKLPNGEFVYPEPPYAIMPKSQAKVTDVYLKEGDEFFIVEYQNRSLQHEVPGGWAADYEVKDIKEVREKLQVLKEWKNEDEGILVVRKYKVKAGQKIPARQGYIGNLKTRESENRKIYPN